jgi:hypothetical protein
MRNKKSRLGREYQMSKRHRAKAIVIALTSGIIASSAPAIAFELTGVWTTDSQLCDKVFDRKGSQVTFSELSDLYGSGFVIDGNRITGKTAKCTITSRKDNGDEISLTASCATSIMVQTLQFALKVNGDDSFSRTFSDIPGMAMSYQRCKF